MAHDPRPATVLDVSVVSDRKLRSLVHARGLPALGRGSVGWGCRADHRRPDSRTERVMIGHRTADLARVADCVCASESLVGLAHGVVLPLPRRRWRCEWPE